MKHPTEIKNKVIVDLVDEISNLRYDVLADFLVKLSDKIGEDGLTDKARGRPKLARALFLASDSLETASLAVQDAWTISEPYMK
jgi:hypothetical protein